jgi:hypothetical protein
VPEKESVILHEEECLFGADVVCVLQQLRESLEAIVGQLCRVGGSTTQSASDAGRKIREFGCECGDAYRRRLCVSGDGNSLPWGVWRVVDDLVCSDVSLGGGELPHL